MQDRSADEPATFPASLVRHWAFKAGVVGFLTGMVAGIAALLAQ